MFQHLFLYPQGTDWHKSMLSCSHFKLSSVVTQCAEVLAARPGYLSSISRSHVGEGVLWLPLHEFVCRAGCGRCHWSTVCASRWHRQIPKAHWPSSQPSLISEFWVQWETHLTIRRKGDCRFPQWCLPCTHTHLYTHLHFCRQVHTHHTHLKKEKNGQSEMAQWVMTLGSLKHWVQPWEPTTP